MIRNHGTQFAKQIAVSLLEYGIENAKSASIQQVAEYSETSYCSQSKSLPEPDSDLARGYVAATDLPYPLPNFLLSSPPPIPRSFQKFGPTAGGRWQRCAAEGMISGEKRPRPRSWSSAGQGGSGASSFPGIKEVFL